MSKPAQTDKTQQPRRALSPGEAHVYFYSLPEGEVFEHQGERYTKTGEEEAKDVAGKAWVFESHYGCIISAERAATLKLPASAHRPLD